jgi:hypothetical protein
MKTLLAVRRSIVRPTLRMTRKVRKVMGNAGWSVARGIYARKV